MTSGIFHATPIDQIVIKRDERQRRELTNLDELAESISRLGLIHPVVVTREGLELVAGERRLSACKLLGWTSIPVQYVDELDPAKLRAIELEENIKRKDISWKDQVNAVAEYHRLRRSDRPDWNQNDTAAAVGISQQHVSHLMMAAEELASGNKLVAEAPKLSTAIGIARRARERKDQQVVEELRSSLGGVALPAVEAPKSILVADFAKWVNDPPEDLPRFNFIHCDFPYGIEADSFNQGGAASHGGYEDTKETWETLINALGTATHKLCAPSCHLMFWFAMRKRSSRLYESTALALERFGWEVNPMPLIWVKSDGAGIIPDPERGPRQIYETCLLASRGDRKIIRAVANAHSSPTVRDRHMSEKPEPMLKHFFAMLVDNNTVMLDPTCGSGSALRAAESLGARFVLGLEINEEFAKLALKALEQSRTLKKAEELV